MMKKEIPDVTARLLKTVTPKEKEQIKMVKARAFAKLKKKLS